MKVFVSDTHETAKNNMFLALKNALSLLKPQSSFGVKHLKLQVVCSPNETAVLKWLTYPALHRNPSEARREKEERDATYLVL